MASPLSALHIKVSDSCKIQVIPFSRERDMPKITSKGQVTIPKNIRNRFGFLPGTEVDIIEADNKADNKALIVKSSLENKFEKWLGRGRGHSRQEIDHMVDKLRGRIDE
jgi:AbrB family looped-hinge helix DNA binding protein